MPHVPSGSVSIHYQDTGATDGPPVVLLPGFMGSGLSWPRAWIADLEQDTRLLRVCNRGTGRSDPVDDGFTLSDMASDVVAVLDDAGVDRATVFGHSMGGMLAQTVALEHPDRVAGLVLAGSAPPMPSMVMPPMETMGTLTQPPPADRDEARAWLDRVWASVAAPGFAERGRQVLKEMVQDSAQAPTPRQTITLQAMAIATFVGPDRLASVDVPAAVVHGLDDPLMPPENGRLLADLVPGASLHELDGVGHLVPWEAPDETAAIIRKVLP